MVTTLNKARRALWLFGAVSLFASFGFSLGAEGDSAYAVGAGSDLGTGIERYRALDAEAEKRRESLGLESASEGEVFSTRTRYSSLDGTAVSSEIPQEKRGASSDAGALEYPVGSDAYLDAATAEVYGKRTVQEDAVEASSGLGSTRERTKTRGLFGYPVETSARDGETFRERWVEPDVGREGWVSQLLPEGLAYPSYLAGRKVPRLESIINHAQGYGTLWDITLGGRTAIWRYGTTDVVRPEGWELELEGAALLRLDWERHRNLAATDYRAGLPLVYATKRWQFKTGYYHVSSHLGDNYLMDKFRPRFHYSRDAIMFGLALTPVPDVRLYAEIDYAFHCGRTTEPLEFQFGVEYSPQYEPGTSNWIGRPFFASHAHLYQERDFGGYWATQTGVQWRSASNGLLRLGAEYFQGGDDLYQFHRTFQRKYGFGIWYDF